MHQQIHFDMEMKKRKAFGECGFSSKVLPLLRCTEMFYLDLLYTLHSLM